MLKILLALMLLLLPMTSQPMDREFECLARNVYYEARGESKQGKLAVALVTLNRLDNKNYPKSICDVVFQKRQFSWTNSWKGSKLEAKQWKLCKDAAFEAYMDRRILGNFPATHYHNLTVKPKWGLKRLTRINNHIFYV